MSAPDTSPLPDGSAPEGVLELPDMQGRWLEGKLAMAPVWPYLYSLSKEPLGGKFSITTSPGLTNPGGTVYSWGFAAASGSKMPTIMPPPSSR